MRKDMAKVVTEAPRRGHRNPSQKFGGRLTRDEIEDEDRWEKFRSGLIPWSRHRNKDYKEFSDVLGPLRRYLRKQVGRPWDKVWSELSETLDKRSVSGSHIFDHIKHEVATECWVGVSGTIYRDKRYWGTTPVDGLYVHPWTRLLCYKPERRYRQGRYRRQAAFENTLRTFPDRHGRESKYYRIADAWTVWEHRDNGLWFIYRYRPRDPETIVQRYTRSDGVEVVRRLGPGYKELVNVKQASKKEIREARSLLERAPF